MFRHQERDIVVMVHGDDFVSTADIQDLRWVDCILKENSEITTDLTGHEEESKNPNIVFLLAMLRLLRYDWHPQHRRVVHLPKSSTRGVLC